MLPFEHPSIASASKELQRVILEASEKKLAQATIRKNKIRFSGTSDSPDNRQKLEPLEWGLARIPPRKTITINLFGCPVDVIDLLAPDFNPVITERSN